MNAYCKGCVYHHNAGHPKRSALKKYNDWCIYFGGKASRLVGHCKVIGGIKRATAQQPTDAAP
jgi:hypothetical protein